MNTATLEILERANVAPLQARAIAQVVDIELDAMRATFVTKSDSTALATKADLATAKAEVVSDLMRWMFLLVMGQSATLLGAIYFLFNLYVAK